MTVNVIPPELLAQWRCTACGFTHYQRRAGEPCPTCAEQIADRLRTFPERLAKLRATVAASRHAGTVVRL